jgi:hypothetical protein
MNNLPLISLVICVSIEYGDLRDAASGSQIRRTGIGDLLPGTRLVPQRGVLPPAKLLIEKHGQI